MRVCSRGSAEIPAHIEAQLLRAQHQPEAAADKFAAAAALEERLRDICLQKGLWEKAFVHGFSAASCWAQAGDFHHAIGLCHDLLAHPELPERLRRRIDAYVKTLCPSCTVVRGVGRARRSSQRIGG